MAMLSDRMRSPCDDNYRHCSMQPRKIPGFRFDHAVYYIESKCREVNILYKVFQRNLWFPILILTWNIISKSRLIFQIPMFRKQCFMLIDKTFSSFLINQCALLSHDLIPHTQMAGSKIYVSWLPIECSHKILYDSLRNFKANM